MKKKVGIDETRRRFMSYFANVGLGATLVPGILWARMQDAQAAQITLEQLTDALKLSGVEFSEAERQTMVRTANTNLASNLTIQKFHIPNDVSPPFHINAVVPGVVVSRKTDPFALGKVPNLKAPGNLEDAAFWPVRHLSELLRTKQVSSVELTKMYLDRLHRYNPVLNNTVTFLDEHAMELAKKADVDITAGRMKTPLQGIPWGCKDIISAKGYPTTWGSGALKTQVFDYDSSVVEMLTNAGAVLMAKLTSGEMAEGDAWFGGTTKNPWSVTTGSSGSSAGPGSATAAGCVGFSIGTETSGSILSPSRTCGVTGLRPTYGRISRYGAMALGWTYDRLGPMCRYAEDCAMVMSIVAKPDGRDMSISDLPFNWNPGLYDLKKMRIGVAGLKGPNINPNAQKFMDTLKAQGATFVEYTPPDVSDLPRYPGGYNYEQGAFFDEFVRGGGVERMTRPARGADFKSARLMNVVDFLQGERIRMMAMTRLAKATAGLDAYFSAAGAAAGAGGGGTRGGTGATGAAAAGGGRGGRGAGAAGANGAPGAPGAAVASGATAAAAGGGRGGGGGAPGGGTGDTNSAGHPGLNIVVAFGAPTDLAPAGLPQSVTLYAPPFKETELCFVGKCFQDVAQMHTKKPMLKG